MRKHFVCAFGAITVTSFLSVQSVYAANDIFDGLDHWRGSRTASPGDTGTSSSVGLPSILTWSIVPDGTATDIDDTIPPFESSLIAELDGKFGSGPGGGDLTLRPWFGLFEIAYGRWGDLSGLTFHYESEDDGTKHGQFSLDGALGVRGDMRIAGMNIDGNSGSNTLAYNYFPDNGDMLIDVANSSSWGLYDPVTDSGSKFLINILTHEIGHGLGLPHLESDDTRQLMEPFINTSFYGPQLEDILMVQRLYGDFYESGMGNNDIANAQAIGTLTSGAVWSIGGDADLATGGEIFGTDVDFVTIDDETDVDVYSFSLDIESDLLVLLSPEGYEYDWSEELDGGSTDTTDMRELSDLVLELLDNSGSVITAIDDAAVGAGEELLTTLAAGDYFLRVSGLDDNAQFYQLGVLSEAIPEPATLGLMMLSALGMMSRRRRA
ncbi:matrixin family metalloprotease [Planctomycetota bacterium]|nr:matrixin family metalloprotease [Planctomycetota bacterium]